MLPWSARWETSGQIEGGGGGRSEARRLLTSSSRISDGEEGQGSMGVMVLVRSSVTNRARRNR